MSKNVRIDNSVVIYCRVSTDAQDKSGLGLEAQLQLCREVAARLGKVVIGEFREQVSGKVDPKLRPVFEDARKLAFNSGASMMVARLDRFSREVYHVSGYTQKYLYGRETPDLIVAESPSMSQLEIYIKAMISEEERKLIAKRTRDALAILKERGAQLGKAGREVAHAKYQEVNESSVLRAIELRAEGYSYARIADFLNQEGFTTSKGGAWYPAEIRKRMLVHQSKN